MEFGLAIICHSCDNACWLQISTSSASCSFLQICSPPPTRHNGAASAPWAPPRGQPPSPSLLQNFLVCSFHGGHSCLEEALL
ncbi:unnamed protein product [Gadus morhua 'NCC']